MPIALGTVAGLDDRPGDGEEYGVGDAVAAAPVTECPPCQGFQWGITAGCAKSGIACLPKSRL